MLGRLMSGLLVGVPHSDVATFLAAGVLLAAAATIASVVPALRATRIDPVRALRAE
jgi:ABC-type lipoprotein release transport system permease subunit